MTQSNEVKRQGTLDPQEESFDPHSNTWVFSAFVEPYVGSRTLEQQVPRCEKKDSQAQQQQSHL